MHYLITGGLGFIGSNFIRFLLNNQDTKITNIDIISHGANPDNLEDIQDQKKYSFIKGDICDKETVKKHLENIDIVVNFAAESHVDRSISDPRPFFKSNTEGVLNILELMRQTNKNIKFFQIGTDESYGDITEGSFKEEDRLTPSSPYAASKAAADVFCLAYHRTYGLDVTLTRCTNNFGPFQFPEKLIPKTIIRAEKNLKVPIYGSGKNVRDWIYVIDHCEAVKSIIDNGKSGQIYNISSGNELQNTKVVETILELMDKPPSLMEFVEDRPGHDIRYSLDSSKIRKELGWSPRYQFVNAIKETVKWYINNLQWWSSLVTPQIIHPTPWKLKW